MDEEDEVIDDDERRAAEQGRKDLAEGRTCTLEDMLAIHGLTTISVTNRNKTYT